METKGKFLSTIIFLLVGLTLFAQESRPAAEYEKISDRVLLLKTGKVYTDQIMAIATKKGIVVIDAGLSPTQTEEYRKIIEREFGRNDFIYLINTHSHSDHMGGNQVFADINIIAQERVPEAMKQFESGRKRDPEMWQRALPERKTQLSNFGPESEAKQRLRDLIEMQEIYSGDYINNFKPTLPTITFNDELKLDLGDLTLELYYYGEGAHADDDIIIYCPEEKIIFAGDLFYKKSIQFAYKPQFDAPHWISVLDEILKNSNGLNWVFDTHNGRMTGEFLRMRHKYVSELWLDISNEKGKKSDIKTILKKYPLSKYNYLEASGIDNAALTTQNENNLRLSWLCINEAKSGQAVLQQVLNESGIKATQKKYSEIKKEIGKKYYFNEDEMNVWGYNLMSQNKINEAIEIFKMNVDLYPESANVYDSIGEAYINDGNTELAIKNYEKSLELNPQNTNAVEQLKRLKDSSTGDSSTLFKSPESIVYDETHDRYLLSNNSLGDLIQSDKNGKQEIFAKRAKAIQGLEIVGNTVYVGAGLSVRGFDLTTGEMVMDLPVADVSNLNDVTSDDNGNLYVSDVFGTKIIKVNTKEKSYSVFIDGKGIDHPNGIVYDRENNRILVCSYRKNSPIQAISLSDSTVTTVATTDIGMCDGIAVDKYGRCYVTSWDTRSIYRFDKNFSKPPELFYKNDCGVADISYDKVHDTLAIPLMFCNSFELVPIKSPDEK